MAYQRNLSEGCGYHTFRAAFAAPSCVDWRARPGDLPSLPVLTLTARDAGPIEADSSFLLWGRSPGGMCWCRRAHLQSLWWSSAPSVLQRMRPMRLGPASPFRTFCRPMSMSWWNGSRRTATRGWYREPSFGLLGGTGGKGSAGGETRPWSQLPVEHRCGSTRGLGQDEPFGTGLELYKTMVQGFSAHASRAVCRRDLSVHCGATCCKECRADAELQNMPWGGRCLKGRIMNGERVLDSTASGRESELW